MLHFESEYRVFVILLLILILRECNCLLFQMSPVVDMTDHLVLNFKLIN